MFKRIKMLVAAFIVVSVSVADTVRLNENAPERYVVVKGDTLWDISGMFLEDPWLWPEIWMLNQQIDNPHLIYPGDELAMVWMEGQQRLTTVRRGDAARTLKMRPGGTARAADGTVQLQPSIRVEPIENAIPSIHRQYIQAFLNGNRIIDQAILQRAGYVLSGDEGRLILGTGDRLYARGTWDKDHSSYEIFRPGKEIVDFESGEFLGFEAIGLGEATLDRIDGEIGSFDVDRAFESIGPSDRLLVLPPEKLEPVFYPSAPKGSLEGRIVHVPGGVQFAGQFDVVTINRGERNDVEPGNIIDLWRRGEEISDPVTGDKVRLPKEQAGRGMVFRTFEKLSYVIILEAQSPLRIGDSISEPR